MQPILFTFQRPPRLRAKRVRVCASTLLRAWRPIQGRRGPGDRSRPHGGKTHPQPAGRGLPWARNLRRRGHARADGGRVPLVRGPAGRNHQLRPRISAVLRFHGPGAPPRGLESGRRRNPRGRGYLRSLAGRAVHCRARARRHAERQAGRVSRIGQLAEALLATGFPSHKRHANPNIHFYQEFTLRSHGVRRAGSAALDLAYVACGRWTPFGSSISIPGIRPREFCWWRRPAGA